MDERFRKLERLASQGDPLAIENLAALRVRLGKAPVLPKEWTNGWVNAFVNGEPICSLYIWNNAEIERIWKFLLKNKKEHLRIYLEDRPCFNETGLLRRQPIREGMVSLVLVESLAENLDEISHIETVEEDVYTFLNVYDVSRQYGGVEEGGWYFDWYDPLGFIRIPQIVYDVAAHRDQWPRSIRATWNFLRRQYKGEDISIQFSGNPPAIPVWPHYG